MKDSELANRARSAYAEYKLTYKALIDRGYSAQFDANGNPVFVKTTEERI